MMHADEVPISLAQVVTLIADQLPDLRGEAISPVTSGGTVNAVFRVGDRVAARFPLRGEDPRRLRAHLLTEHAAAHEFRKACPVAAPEPLLVGRPGHGYPMPWTVQTWLPGRPATPTGLEHSHQLARDLAELIRTLRAADTRGRQFRGGGRGGDLTSHDVWIAHSIRNSEGLIDTHAMTRTWEESRVLPRKDPDAMCHGDLTPANLLLHDGRLVGVLDTGGYGPADPALDLVAAWHLLEAGPRDTLRSALSCPDLQWQRGRAWAFEQAAGALWYYQDTNPTMAEMAATTLRRVLTCRN